MACVWPGQLGFHQITIVNLDCWEQCRGSGTQGQIHFDGIEKRDTGP